MIKSIVYSVCMPKSDEMKAILVRIDEVDTQPISTCPVIAVISFGYKSAFDVCDILRTYTAATGTTFFCPPFCYGGLITSMRALKAKYNYSKSAKKLFATIE